MKTKQGAIAMSAIKTKDVPTNHGDGYLTKAAGFMKGHKLLHRLIAEKALGKPLPQSAVVHHIDGNRANNRNDNLVICQDNAHHQLLHRRARALKECGHADWRRCYFCKTWDDPKNLYIPPGTGAVEHRQCGRKYRSEYLRNKRIEAGNPVGPVATVLNESDVLEIRAKYEAGGYTYKQLGGEYNIGPSQAGRIINRTSWTNI
ncbi:MAG: HNH endonuclease [Candidatus Cloacimonetes bacterium]|jgi:hypothetical protein|nr:HNH endonuclease [Candidatus Cloacimonadota bacterium]MDY0368069.1 HNH endonuclease signature motif containing protein [Candidatus Syntrophosphaera sp.]